MGPLPPFLPPKFDGIQAPGIPLIESPRVTFEEGEGPKSPPVPKEGSESLETLLDHLRHERRACATDDTFITKLVEMAFAEGSGAEGASGGSGGGSSQSNGGGGGGGGGRGGGSAAATADPYLWYRKLLGAVTETLLGDDVRWRGTSASSSSSSYCALHRARLRAVHGAAAFFCRIKATSDRPVASPTPITVPRDATRITRPSLPEVCVEELRRRLKTYLLSLLHEGPSEAVDQQRRADLVMSFNQLKSRLAPLDIMLDSLLHPLLEFLCCDVLMSNQLGDEVKNHLDDLVMGLKSHHDNDLWSAAKGTMGSIWRMAVGGSGGAKEGRGGNGSSSPPLSRESQLLEEVGNTVDELVQWLREHAKQLHLSGGTEEVLAMVDPGLRRLLLRQEYRSLEQFFEVFHSLEKQLGRIRLPPSHQTCGVEERECELYDLTASQVEKDLSRERFCVEGEEVMGLGVKEQVRSVLCEWGRRVARGKDVEVVLREEALKRVMLAASRTVFGGDAYFIVNDLFGGEGVTIMPTKDPRPHHDAITFTLHPPEGSGGANGTPPLLCQIMVRCPTLLSLFHNLAIRQATETGPTPTVHLWANVIETFPIEAHRDSSGSPLYLTVGSGTTRIIQVQAQRPSTTKDS